MFILWAKHFSFASNLNVEHLLSCDLDPLTLDDLAGGIVFHKHILLTHSIIHNV